MTDPVKPATMPENPQPKQDTVPLAQEPTKKTTDAVPAAAPKSAT